MKIFLTFLLLLLVMLSLFLGIDEYALQIQDEAFDRAMISFGIAKGLNAIISLIQGTQLSITPVGVGLNFSVGEVLDPFNDMVERFSWVMLAATVSLGIQKILLILSAKIYLQVALGVATAVSIAFLWMKNLYDKKFFILPFKILLFLFVLRFGAIVSVYSTQLLYDSVLHQQYTTSSEVVVQAQQDLEKLHENTTQLHSQKKESSWYESDILKEVGMQYEEMKSKLDISKNLEAIQDKISDASENIINLITIFIIQTILMPLLFLWLMVLSMKWIFRVDASELKTYFGSPNF